MADLTGLPDLPTGTDSSQSAGTTSSQSKTDTSSKSDTSSSSGSSTSSGTRSATGSPSVTLTTSGGSVISLTGLPTLAGAGIPVLEIPYTANAPFMQKSTMPEGTVFIAVGAVLAFLGACVLLWRGLIAWSINRSVRRAALASIGGSEKASTYWGGSGKGGTYTEITGSNMSMVDLTSSGRRHTFKDDRRHDSSPAGLFFSPTAQAAGNNSSANIGSRNSSYLPAGYYASPSSHAGGGGGATTIGGNLAPYARHSAVNPSPPGSPQIHPADRNNATYRATSRDGLKPGSRDGHDASRRALSSGYHNQPNGSSLMTGGNDLAGQRAPSAYLEDLFENHGNGPRERF